MGSHHITHGTAYWIYNDNSKLPNLVMIHGYRGTHHGLELIAKQLDEYRIIVPDLPGFGESKPLKNEHSLNNYAEWLNRFINGLKLDRPPILLGHSFGSIIASKFASEHPDSIEKLILVNPIGSPALEGPRAILTRMALAYYWLGRKLPQPLATQLLSAKPVVLLMSSVMAKTHNIKSRKYIHSQHLEHFSEFANRQVAAEAFKASVQNNVRDVANSINVPTLIIAGDLDDITPLKKQYELNDLFPKSQIEVINGVGHLTHYEKPIEVADAIKKFLR
jgi:pimeloyl-ACP methyl ester carboxylesterase